MTGGVFCENPIAFCMKLAVFSLNRPAFSIAFAVDCYEAVTGGVELLLGGESPILACSEKSVDGIPSIGVPKLCPEKLVKTTINPVVPAISPIMPG
jgi:hypothetical protein